MRNTVRKGKKEIKRKMSNEDTLKQKLLDMAKVFHEFCMKHGLQYFMIGGTMLGAVRHKGFIPWDDDMDFGMLRKDYDRMMQLRTELPQGYSFNDYKTVKGYKYGFCKMYDENTTYIESAQDTKLIGGVYIDIFRSIISGMIWKLLKKDDNDPKTQMDHQRNISERKADDISQNSRDESTSAAARNTALV